MLVDALKFLVSLSVPSTPELFDLNGVKAAFMPERLTLKTFEETRERPARIEKHIIVQDIPSFAGYYTRFADSEKALITATESRQEIKLTIDAHEKDKPDFEKHSCTLKLNSSLEFSKWASRSGQFQTQKTFAEFLEDNLDDIVTPDPGAILEVATNLSNVKTTQFRSGLDLQNGNVQLQFVETDTQQIDIPKTFVICVPVYEHGPKYNVMVRFRWKVDNDNKLSLSYEIAKEDRIVKKAFADIVADVEKALSNKTILKV